MLRRYYFSTVDGLLKISNPTLAQAFSVKSHLTIRERIVLFNLSFGKDTVIEIGSYLGASACCFGAAMKKSCAGRLFCIDTWNNDAMTEGVQDTYAEFLKNTEPFAQYIIPIRGFSTEVVNQIPIGSSYVDVLFIDGDHSFSAVKADWEAYKKFLKADSVVAFHDCGWAEGVKRVILEDVKPLVSKFGGLPNMWWGTIQS